MESLDYWRLCDELTIIQAALLIVGEDPSFEQEYVEERDAHQRTEGYEAAKAALKSAIRSGKIDSRKIYQSRQREWVETMACWDGEPDTDEPVCKYDGRQFILNNEPDWFSTTVSVDSLKKWLTSRGILTGFFFPNKQHNIAYLDESNPKYAPKLAAAVIAWEEVTQNEALLCNKSPKQALEAWLEVNTKQFNLSTQAVGEIAKVANWNPKGGVPATVTSKTNISDDLDAEITF